MPTPKSQNHQSISTEVLIVGGGLVGSVMGLALSKFGIKTVIIDKQSDKDFLSADHDSRTTAVNYGSAQIFKNLGLWETLTQNAQPILNIKVIEGNSPWGVYYDHKDVSPEPMGHILYNYELKKILWEHANKNKNITWIASTDIEEMDTNNFETKVRLSTGQFIQAQLIICAQGRNAPLRDQMGIKTKTWSYNQSAIVCHIAHEKPHHNVAWEVFYPEGPLALLPLEKKKDRHQSGIVWSLSPNKAQQIYELQPEDFTQELQKNFGHYGKLTLEGKRWLYPLSALKSETITANRFALIGDAAHVIHPVAGQGVNLGWRDVAILTQVLYKAKNLGLDLGSYTVLQDYEQWARKTHHGLLVTTDIMTRLFSNSSSILGFVRSKGLGIVNQIPPLKRYLMRQAMGIEGKVPYLMGGSL